MTFWSYIMSHKLTVRAFFFNAKTDYLPYYKNFTLKLAEDATAKSIVQAIKAQNDMFSYPALNLVFKINDLVVEEDTPVASIIERLGDTLQIDPVSTYRANNGLIINDHDFMQSFELLAPYASTSDKKYYKGLYALHYASETSNFERSYIGDAVLMLAHKMISEGNEHKDAILEAISSPHSGLFDCEYENNLFNAEHHEAEITALKHLARPQDEPSLFSKLMTRFSKQEEEVIVERQSKVQNIENLLEKSIAYYPALANNETMDKLIDEQHIKLIKFSRAHKLSGATIMEGNKALALEKAGTTLLDAYDAGAEVLVVESTDKYETFVKHFSAIESTIGRKMLGLELICAEDFISQVSTMKS